MYTKLHTKSFGWYIFRVSTSHVYYELFRHVWKIACRSMIVINHVFRRIYSFYRLCRINCSVFAIAKSQFYVKYFYKYFLHHVVLFYVISFDNIISNEWKILAMSFKLDVKILRFSNISWLSTRRAIRNAPSNTLTLSLSLLQETIFCYYIS